MQDISQEDFNKLKKILFTHKEINGVKFLNSRLIKHLQFKESLRFCPDSIKKQYSNVKNLHINVQI